MLILTHTCKSQFYLLPEPGNYQKKKKSPSIVIKIQNNQKLKVILAAKFINEKKDTFLEIGNGL